MERKPDAITPTITHSHGPAVTERERQGRAHPSPGRAPPRQAAGGTRQPTQLVTPTRPFAAHPPELPVRGAGKGRAGAGAPLETFQGGKAPDGEDKDERAELS